MPFHDRLNYHFYYRYGNGNTLNDALCLIQHNDRGEYTRKYRSYAERTGEYSWKDPHTEEEAVEELCSILFDRFETGNDLMRFLESIVEVAQEEGETMQMLAPILRAANHPDRFNVMALDRTYPNERGDALRERINELMPVA